ncbi:MAG: type II toxin-antitoxin system Phd/YefM family antitoxin [Deltaproteobacteria bacterium]|nr:type II toxin-antitoxin system Phd/YefM family antitoxin [Deltaproteobacteria bacterium]
MIHPDKILPVTQVKRELTGLLKHLKRRGGVVAITTDGRATGVLMTTEEYEGLMESLEILGDVPLLRSLNRALRENRQGKVYSHKEVFRD